MQFTDLATAQRLEGAEAALSAGCAMAWGAADPACGSRVEEIAGGLAICFGPGSPLNKCTGLGLQGQVGPGDLDRVEALFRDRGGRVVVDVCPLADSSLLELLSGRGYAVAELENVLVLPLADWRPPPEWLGRGVEVRVARAEEAEQWSRTVGEGFAAEAAVTDEMMRMGTAIFNTPGCASYFGVLDGHTAGGGGVGMHRGVAALYGTSVLPRFRSRGVHRAMLVARLIDAQRAGCDLAKIATRPGSISQRNAERLGFRVVYTKPQVAKVLAT